MTYFLEHLRHQQSVTGSLKDNRKNALNKIRTLRFALRRSFIIHILTMSKKSSKQCF